MKTIALVPALFAGLSLATLPALASDTTTSTPHKVTIEPAPGAAEASAAATVATAVTGTQQQLPKSEAAPAYGDMGGVKRNCHGSRKVQALIN